MGQLISYTAAPTTDQFTYDEPYPWWYASTSSAPVANTLNLMEAPNRDTDITVGVIRVKVGATSNGNLKVAAYTFDGTTWTLVGSSASTAVGTVSTIQAVSLSSSVVIRRGVRRFYGLVTDGTATFFRMAGPDTNMGFLQPSAASKASSFTLPSSMVVGDLAVTSFIPWMRASAA